MLRTGSDVKRKARALPWTRWGRRPQTPFVCYESGIYTLSLTQNKVMA